MEKIKKPENTGTSWGLNDNVVADMIKRITPSSVVDFGCGLGKYGLMCKDVLKYDFDLIGIDGYEPTIQWLGQENIYKSLILGDLKDTVYQKEKEKLDLAIFGDCLEHLEYGDMMKVVRNASKNFKYIIIVVPLNDYEQNEDNFENKLEGHRCKVLSNSYDEYNVIEKHLISAVAEWGTIVKMAVLIKNDVE